MALRQETGTRGSPVIISDMLENAGPVALLDRPHERMDWFQSIGFEIDRFRGYDSKAALIADWEAFWTRIDDWEGSFVFWFSSVSAEDRSLLLAASNRIGKDREVFLIDVAEPADNLPGVSSVGGLAPESLRLWIPQAERLDQAGRQRLSEEYARLNATRQGLRLFSVGQLIEAPVEALDDRILSRLTADWAPLSRTCAGIEGAFGNGGFRDFPYTLLLWRLDELQKARRIERRGGAFDATFKDDPRQGEVRLTG